MCSVIVTVRRVVWHLGLYVADKSVLIDLVDISIMSISLKYYLKNQDLLTKSGVCCS